VVQGFIAYLKRLSEEFQLKTVTRGVLKESTTRGGHKNFQSETNLGEEKRNSPQQARGSAARFFSTDVCSHTSAAPNREAIEAALYAADDSETACCPRQTPKLLGRNPFWAKTTRRDTHRRRASVKERTAVRPT